MFPILYVEDNEQDIILVKEASALADIQNRIDVVRNGEEALEYLRYQGAFEDRPQEFPGLILLDNKMPRMTGLEFLDTFRADATLPLIPVVMFTSSVLASDVQKSYELGANAYVEKPMGLEQLIETLGHIYQFWATINLSSISLSQL